MFTFLKYEISMKYLFAVEILPKSPRSRFQKFLIKLYYIMIAYLNLI